MDIFTKLAENLTKMVKDRIHLKALKKEDLEDFLKDNIFQHKEIAKCLTANNPRQMMDWMRDKVRPALQKSTSACSGSYDNYCKALTGRAAAEENRAPLASLAKANNTCADLLEEVLKGIDTLFEEEHITIYDVRLSQVAILGIIRKSDLLLKFSSYLYSYLVRIATDNTENIPRNRDLLLSENAQRVGQICSEILNRSNSYSFLKEVDGLRRDQSDLVLGASGDFKFNGFVNRHKFSFSIMDNIASALSCLNFFSAALDAWDDYKLSRYERNKEIREWLGTHVALLKMDLANTDVNDPKYVKLQQIINAYDDKIAEYDKVIDEFEQQE